MPAPRLYATNKNPAAIVSGAGHDGLETQGNASGKRVALLVNGPSLASVWREDHCLDFDVIVAMNTAAWLFPCDYMVATDQPLVREVLEGRKARPRLGLVCYAAHKAQCQKVGIPWIELESIPKAKPYTFPRAIVFSLKQAGEGGSVECFGVDWSGAEKDAAGVRGDHGPERWAQEGDVVRKVWDRRIVAVHGKIAPERLAYFRGERGEWPR